MLKHGAIVDNEDCNLIHILLHEAAAKGHAAVCNLLINHGASVNITDDCNKTALLMAAKGGYHHICNLLLDHGAIVNKEDNNMTPIPLHEAAGKGHAAVCNLLINHGASINKTDACNETALSNAAHGGYGDVCKLLLDKGAIVDKCNIFGSTPLHAAIKLGRTDVCKLLLSQGASVNAADNLNLIPFWIAAKNLDYICNLLLDHALTAVITQEKIFHLLLVEGSNFFLRVSYCHILTINGLTLFFLPQLV